MDIFGDPQSLPKSLMSNKVPYSTFKIWPRICSGSTKNVVSTPGEIYGHFSERWNKCKTYENDVQTLVHLWSPRYDLYRLL